MQKLIYALWYKFKASGFRGFFGLKVYAFNSI